MKKTSAARDRCRRFDGLAPRRVRAGGGGGDEGGGDGGLIGVAMPTKSSERWIQDGDAVKEQLEEQGFTVDLQYAEDDIPTQVSQVENMITKGAEALIIAAIDGTTLSQVLQDAADADIPVIAYDRLIRDSENVDYYASFDNFLVGQQQAWSVLNGLGLTELDGTPIDGAPAGPFNIELFAGSLDDNNAFFFFDGAIDVLQPLIDDGTLVVKSGQTDIEQAATLRWDGEVAQERMENILTSTYSDGIDGQRACSRRTTASRAASSRRSPTPATAVGEGWPIISGQDAEIDSVQGDQLGRAVRDHLQGHARARGGGRGHGRRAAERRGARGEQHRGLRQRREGRSVVPARAR